MKTKNKSKSGDLIFLYEENQDNDISYEIQSDTLE